MSIAHKALRFLVTALMLLGTGAWSGHAPARALPPLGIAASAQTLKPLADQQAQPAAAACSPATCMVAIVTGGRMDAGLGLRRVAVRYAAWQQTGPPGIEPVPLPFPPRY